MIEAMVKLIDGGKFKGLGRMKFFTLPRTGDFISRDDDRGYGHRYRVVAVDHPYLLESEGSRPGLTHGNVYVTSVSDLNAHLASLAS